MARREPAPKPHRMSRAGRRAAFVEAAGRMFDELEDWYDQHPEASFGELEAEARRWRRELMGDGLGGLVNGRDSGYQLTPPICGQCQQPMSFEAYRSKTIYGLEGDTELSRAYYVCPRCQGQTLSPPRPQVGPAGRSLE